MSNLQEVHLVSSQPPEEDHQVINSDKPIKVDIQDNLEATRVRIISLTIE